MQLPTYAFLSRLVFWNSIHQEVASDSFCFLINSSWLLVFILYVFFISFSGFNLYSWKGIHFSISFLIIFYLYSLFLVFSFHFWFRDLLRESYENKSLWMLDIYYLPDMSFWCLGICLHDPEHLFLLSAQGRWSGNPREDQPEGCERTSARSSLRLGCQERPASHRLTLD
jgi:hypothetical protein